MVMKKKRIPLDLVAVLKEEYIKGTSIRELSKKYDIDYKYLNTYILVKKRWSAERKRIAKGIDEKIQKVIENYKEEIVKLAARNLAINAKYWLDIIDRAKEGIEKSNDDERMAYMYIKEMQIAQEEINSIIKLYKKDDDKDNSKEQEKVVFRITCGDEVSEW